MRTMHAARRPLFAIGVALVLVHQSDAVSAQRATKPAPDAPMRIVLLVDSSSAISPMLTHFRAGLSMFLDVLPGEPEIAFISTGGQLQVRVPPTTDRVRLKTAVGTFASQGGGNAFLDSLLEADKRFLKNVPAKWGVFVIVTTDAGDSRVDTRIDDYNDFAADFVARGGRAYAVLIHGKNSGIVSDIVANLVKNTKGALESGVISTALPSQLETLAAHITADAQSRGR